MQDSADLARQRAYMPAGTATILDARSLATAHRRLAAILKPGMSVLDVGCGTGAITRGIAEVVGPEGRVVGIDINKDLLARARQMHGDIPGLTFQEADLYALPFHNAFDIVTAARVIQWLDNPLQAVQMMADAAKPGGWVIVLDYNHEKIQWEPEPPESMQHFYQAHLKWRSDAGMDNRIADHLAQIFATIGLQDIQVTQQHERVVRSDPNFAQAIQLWAEVAASRGRQLVQDGTISEEQRAAAEREFREWGRSTAQMQTLYLLSVEGRRREASA